MNYELFKSYVLEHIEDVLPNLQEPMYSVRSILKNNGIKLDALQIMEKGKECSPNIYLNQIYDDYIQGKPIGVCLNHIAKQYQNAVMDMDVEINTINDFHNMQDKIILRLLNYERNKELLKDAPYIPLMDFAITFRWMAHQDEEGIASALVTKKELAQWEISVSELYEIALANTQRMFPYSFDSMDMLMKYMKPSAELNPNQQSNLYVLSNKKGINGATSLLYDGVLSFFAKEFQDDLYILPSSVHELILLPAKKCPEGSDLYSIVAEANQMVVPPEDFLSEKVYIYKRGMKRVEIVGEL